MHANIPSGVGRHLWIVALFAALTVTVTAQSAGAQDRSVRAMAHDNCVVAMQAFPEQVSDPGGMCGCMIGEVFEQFAPASADAVLGAMAAVSPDERPWVGWTQPPALKAAGALPQQDAEALSDAVDERLGGETQRRCAAAPADRANLAAPQRGGAQ